MKCIITGGTGFIGSHLAKMLVKEGWKVSLVVRPSSSTALISDIIDDVELFKYDGSFSDLEVFFKKVQPDVVFHIAAAVITNYKPEDISTIVESNIQFGTEILEAMRYSGCNLFINTGTCWQNYESKSYSPVDLYAASKEAFEKILQFYVESYGYRAATLRLYDVYGEDDTRPKLWNHLVKISQTGESIALSPGEQRLDMVHVGDICNAYLKAFGELIKMPDRTNIIWGVGTGDLRTLKELVELLEKNLENPLNVVFGGKPYKQREVFQPYNGYEKLKTWLPQITIEEGFKRLAKTSNNDDNK